MNTIEKLQNDLSLWYEASSVSQFMHWWTSGLKSFVPAKHQEKFFPQAIRVYLTQEDEVIKVWHDESLNIEPYVTDETVDGEPQNWWHQVQHVIEGAQGKKVFVSFLISSQDALIRKIALPQATKDNLDEVIGFELEKWVPFSSDQVYLSYKIDKENSNEDKLQMDLAVVPKQKLNQILGLCEDKSIELNKVDVNLSKKGEIPKYLGINLLPNESRKSSDYKALKTNLILGLLLMGLIYFVMHTSLSNKQNKIERLNKYNSLLQKQAKTSKLLRKELKEVIVSSKFLQNKKVNHPPIVNLIADITGRLPDSSYVTRLKITQKSLEITGQSDSANSLVPKLDESKSWYAPQIIGSVIKDARTKKEKFTIKADLHKPKPEAKDGNSI